ncbi:PREDICTED: beta-1,4-N-acetylgalactosaminyltransferase bre-4-like [Papilio polytes]|uniref:beta-1,4-N-acetylgalactosaminyltransferase bre-4-like n=1 Tax=Papilio polytes TaxID=76194 RepID=UPI00067676B1|nr:PREDICTED: beta-1,4-N-acetylgalactosaminyltransferase bre-4-like [Papilio polytes]
MHGPISFWWLSHTVRFLLLLVLLLSTVVYYISSILDASSLSTKTSVWSQKWSSTTTKANTMTVKATHSINTFKTISNEIVNNDRILVNASKNMENVTSSTVTGRTVKKRDFRTIKPLCPEVPPGLGPITASKNELYLDYIEKKFPEVKSGGQYAPPNCTARHKIAIIVPFRDRDQHLPIFLNHMHPFLMKQQLEYGIFVIEQYRYRSFNRGKLMNVGFVESQNRKPGGWQCFVFHDIDLLPLDERNLYYCPEYPLHMSVLIDKHDFKVSDMFGGVMVMTLEQFSIVNGFSNKFWGWGGEDDDMHRRVQKMYYGFARYVNLPITKYIMLDHEEAFKNPFRFEILAQTKDSMEEDGLSTLNYKIVKVVKHHLYTQIIADIDKRN